MPVNKICIQIFCTKMTCKYRRPFLFIWPAYKHWWLTRKYLYTDHQSTLCRCMYVYLQCLKKYKKGKGINLCSWSYFCYMTRLILTRLWLGSSMQRWCRYNCICSSELTCTWDTARTSDAKKLELLSCTCIEPIFE